jgi:hypothetical protein
MFYLWSEDSNSEYLSLKGIDYSIKFTLYFLKMMKDATNPTGSITKIEIEIVDESISIRVLNFKL